MSEPIGAAELFEMERDALNDPWEGVGVASTLRLIAAVRGLTLDRNSWRESAAGYGSDAEQARHERDELTQQRDGLRATARDLFEQTEELAERLEAMTAERDEMNHRMNKAWEVARQEVDARARVLAERDRLRQEINELNHRMEMANNAWGVARQEIDTKIRDLTAERDEAKCRHLEAWTAAAGHYEPLVAALTAERNRLNDERVALLLRLALYDDYPDSSEELEVP